MFFRNKYCSSQKKSFVLLEKVWLNATQRSCNGKTMSAFTDYKDSKINISKTHFEPF